MKDYYSQCLFKNKNKKYEYYMYYKKSDKKIIVFLSNGNIEEFENTKENEIAILKKMEEQFESCGENFINYYSEESEEMIKRVSPFIYLSSAFSFIADSPIYIVLNYAVLGLSSLALSKASLEYFISKSTFKDYKKHKLFMDNKELLDVQLNGDLRLLNGVNKKALKEAYNNGCNHQKTININTVRLLKYNELESIIEKAKEKDKKEKKYIFRYR